MFCCWLGEGTEIAICAPPHKAGLIGGLLELPALLFWFFFFSSRLLVEVGHRINHGVLLVLEWGFRLRDVDGYG